MVEIAFEYVGRNKEEVDCIYIYASMEDDSIFYNTFYSIKGNIVKAHKVNDYLSNNPATPEMNKKLLKIGTDFLDETSELFENHNREVPTLMKMTYKPKTKTFDNDIHYEKYFSDHLERTEVDGFNEWFEEMKSTKVN
jgi:hypothetical protein